ncbi:hypothetical protein ACIPUO_12360 [Pectobacterium carotovorum]|uniref:hypothetical protein n=1 Tax=Pectobacterium carotovorum TaxID=554 RepID=UPI0038158FCF
MKKYLGIIMMALWLSGCNGEETLREGKYLIEDIRVVFDNSKHPEANENRDNLQEHIKQNLKGIKNDLYFNLTPTQVSYYSAESEYTEEMKDNRIQVNGMWHTLKITGKNTVQFVSDKSAACAFYYCEITMVLKKTEEQSPGLLKIQQRFEEHKKAYQAWLLEEKAVFNRAPMDDFPGIPFYPEDDFTIKLPFAMFDKLSLREHGTYVRKMGVYSSTGKIKTRRSTPIVISRITPTLTCLPLARQKRILIWHRGWKGRRACCSNRKTVRHTIINRENWKQSIFNMMRLSNATLSG